MQMASIQRVTVRSDSQKVRRSSKRFSRTEKALPFSRTVCFTTAGPQVYETAMYDLPNVSRLAKESLQEIT